MAPSQHWLLSAERKPPTFLKEFLSIVISGKSQQHNSCKTARLVDSEAQDICYAATHGEWVMQKHLLLSMTVSYLSGSTKLITILNRIWPLSVMHRNSGTRNSNVQLNFSKRFSTSPNISLQNNSVIHFCWDNFDLNEETLSGIGTIHPTH